MVFIDRFNWFLGMKPKVKNHFRAHQLSVWLRLIPELHRAGMEDVTVRHNMFHNRENDLYDGIVKTDRHWQNTSNRRPAPSHNGTVAEIIQSITTLEPFLTTCINLPSMVNTAGVAVRSNASRAVPVTEPHSLITYSTTLSLTIAIGCTLLILNVLIFAGVYYQRDKARMEIKNLREQQLQQRQQRLNGQSSDSVYDAKNLPRGYQPNSVMLDIEMENNSKIFNHNMAPARSIRHVYEFPPNSLTRQTQTTNTHISKCDGTNPNSFSCSFDENYYLKSSTNGSVLMMHPSVLPRASPPSRASPPLEDQSLLHHGHPINLTQPHQKCSSILKVPAAAINEMRI